MHYASWTSQLLQLSSQYRALQDSALEGGMLEEIDTCLSKLYISIFWIVLGKICDVVMLQVLLDRLHYLHAYVKLSITKYPLPQCSINKHGKFLYVRT